jgi:hypothetical protein
MQNVDRTQADYWLGNISRREAQNTFDIYDNQINRLLHTLTTMDVLLQFLIEEKLKLDMNEFKEWVAKRAAAVQAAAAQAAPAQAEGTAPAPSAPAQPALVTLT